MRIIIQHDESLRTVVVLRAIADYFDGYCLPETVEPKKYLVDPEARRLMVGNPRGNTSILFA